MKKLFCIAAIAVLAASVNAGVVKSTALEASHVLSGSAAQLGRLDVFNSKGTAQFIMIINTATLPADGAVSLLYPPIPIAAGELKTIIFSRPLSASTGIVVCNSSTGTFSKTIGSADCAFWSDIQ